MDQDSHINPRLVGYTEAVYQKPIAESSGKNTAELGRNARRQSHVSHVEYGSNYFKSAQW